MIPLPVKFNKENSEIKLPENINYKENNMLGSEAYTISVKENGVCVEYSDLRGKIWADQTIKSITKDGKIPVCEISDKPKYHHRGLNFDVSRHFFKVDEVKKILDMMSGLKMNVLHWHLSDDQGFRIESIKYPDLQKESVEFYTREQIKEIVEYAEDRGIEVVPEIDMPGHTRAILAARPDLSCTKRKLKPGKDAGIYKRILCAGNEDVYTFLEELFDEILPLFKSNRFHIGGDEAPKAMWKACPLCKAKLTELGLNNMQELQGYFGGRVAEILKKHEKRPIMWNDALVGRNVSKNAQIQYWTPSYNRQTVEFAKEGGEWIFSDMHEVYLDYPYAMTGLKKMYEMVMDFADEGGFEEYPPIGMEACLWTERVDTNEKLEERLLPRLFALAELSWSDRVTTYEEFEKRAEIEAEKFSERGYAVKEKAKWNPKGEEAKLEAEAFMKSMSTPGTEEDPEEMADWEEEQAEEGKNNKAAGQKYQERFMAYINQCGGN